MNKTYQQALAAGAQLERRHRQQRRCSKRLGVPGASMPDVSERTRSISWAGCDGALPQRTMDRWQRPAHGRARHADQGEGLHRVVASDDPPCPSPSRQPGSNLWCDVQFNIPGVLRRILERIAADTATVCMRDSSGRGMRCVFEYVYRFFTYLSGFIDKIV